MIPSATTKINLDRKYCILEQPLLISFCTYPLENSLEIVKIRVTGTAVTIRLMKALLKTWKARNEKSPDFKISCVSNQDSKNISTNEKQINRIVKSLMYLVSSIFAQEAALSIANRIAVYVIDWYEFSSEPKLWITSSFFNEDKTFPFRIIKKRSPIFSNPAA